MCKGMAQSDDAEHTATIRHRCRTLNDSLFTQINFVIPTSRAAKTEESAVLSHITVAEHSKCIMQHSDGLSLLLSNCTINLSALVAHRHLQCYTPVRMSHMSQIATASQQFFQDVFNASPVGIVVETLEGQPLFANPAFCAFLGFTKEELHTKHCVDFSPPEDAAKDWALFQQLRAGLIDHYQLEKRYFRRDGSLVWGSLSISLLKNQPSPLVIAMVEDITAKKTAEEALRASEERLRLAQQAARIGTFERDFRTGLLTWTSETEALYGLPPGGFGKALHDFEKLIHPEDQARIMNLIDRAKDTGEPTDAEWRVIWPDGSVHWIAGHWQVFKDESGEPGRGIGVNMDITERKQAEDRLREYERAVEGVDELIVVVDRSYRVLMANREFLRRRSIDIGAVVGHFVHEVFEKDLYEKVVKPNLDECFRGKIVRFELKKTYLHLGERDLLAAYYPVEGTLGVDRVACVVHDITERKQAEKALLEANRTLETQTALLQSREDLLKVFVKTVPAAVAMLDRDLRYLQVSDRWCSENGVEASEILGRLRYESGPEIPERWKEVNRRALEGETLRSDEDRWECAGATRWARWEVRPWRNADGTVGGILVLSEDITRRKQMEDELSGMSRKLIDAQEQERTRIGRELHDDINQRLSLLAVELEQLEEIPSGIPKRARELRNQAAEIANDVQALSHELHSSKLEYLGVIGGIRSWCKEFGDRHKIEVDFKSDVSRLFPPEVGLTLFRVLQEGLHNAVKHSGVKRVQVQLCENAGEVHLIINDLGKGFDPNALQEKGLGLISMRERVRLINGSIDIQSKPMSGTTIQVRVPLSSGYAPQRAAG
jgi:PAS domain S-box-containing protein